MLINQILGERFELLKQINSINVKRNRKFKEQLF